MKKIIPAIFVTAALCLISGSVIGQSAVYFCSETGAYGYAYGTTLKDAQTTAYNNCISYGGTKPVLIVSTDKKGFGSIAVGNDANGNRIIGAALGFPNLNDANSEAIKQCQSKGGTGIYVSETWQDK